ncbi:unnamed protein product [Lactuca saligna]|uniref:Protein kinase domain-containing protein n=1 Tax=Lactuca saligna TaxID=75948 RepID=A0AA35YYG7_LACSI|nr:unnamed protein product [Lactuca saligna]
MDLNGDKSLSSSSPCYRWKHDVFLNFRGVDTRKNFVSHLYAALIGQRIKVFKDEKTIRIGRNIFLSISKAIEESRISVVVLSQNYGESVNCLTELEKIFECKRSMGRYVIPVFYHVQPSEVKHQSGCFGDGFAIHGNHMKLSIWRNALIQATNIAGIEVHGNESDCIERIVETVMRELGPRRFPLRSLLPKASAYWCSLNFLMANRHTWVPQADTAGNVSTNHKKKRNKETTEVYDPLNKSVHIGSLNKDVVVIREINPESESSFLEELFVRSRMKHANVAKLFGYCIRDNRRFLVEEHWTQGTLHQILHDDAGNSVISWTQRVTIAYDVAKGLEYLHYQNLFAHIDSSNVLLFDNFNAKISTGSSASESYWAPEYKGRELTMKGNVYSFGVLLFELLTGNKPSKGIVNSVLPAGKIDNIGSLVDLKLNGKYTSREAKKLAFTMLLATMDQPSDRPDMNTIVEYFKKLLAV